MGGFITYDIALRLRNDSFKVDNGIMDKGYTKSEYHAIIITLLKALRDTGDYAIIEVFSKEVFRVDFDHYIAHKLVGDVKPRNFQVTVDEPLHVEGRIYLSKPTMKLKVKLVHALNTFKN